jgi:hypothetical protein
MSGHGGSIRERRAQEIRNGGRKGRRKAKVTKTTPTKGLALLVATKFDDSREQLAVLEKVLLGRLDLGYLYWNGRTR